MNHQFNEDDSFYQTLSRSKQRFVAEYCSNGFNATKAYQYAHPKSSTATAGANGHQLLKNTEVQEAIDEFCRKSVAGRQAILKKRITDTLEVQAFYRITDIMDVETGRMKLTNEELAAAGLAEAVDSVNERKAKAGSTPEYRFADRLAAIAMLCRIMGLYDDKLIRESADESSEPQAIILGVKKVDIEEWNARQREEAEAQAQAILG